MSELNIFNSQVTSYDLVVGMTGFEPATTRPPDEYATGLRHIPNEKISIRLVKQFDTRKLRSYLSETYWITHTHKHAEHPLVNLRFRTSGFHPKRFTT